MHAQRVRRTDYFHGGSDNFDRAPKSNVGYEAKHRALLDRFGRYPHRNAIVGRDSTDEERAFLASDSGF